MKRPNAILLDVEIDKLTNSIENIVTGEAFATVVVPVSAADLKTTIKKNGWLFNWRAETQQPGHRVFKLTTIYNPQVIHGLASVEVRSDHVRLHLVESAPFNKGQTKVYAGVPGNLFAYACKLAFETGHEGNVAFVAKTQLIAHYTASLGAVHVGGHLMILDTKAAHALINRYFNQFHP